MCQAELLTRGLGRLTRRQNQQLEPAFCQERWQRLTKATAGHQGHIGDWTVAYVSVDDLDVVNNIHVQTDPRKIRPTGHSSNKGDHKIVACAAVLGETGPSLAGNDGSTCDTAVLSGPAYGEYILRDASQLMPLIQFSLNSSELLYKIYGKLVKLLTDVLRRRPTPRLIHASSMGLSNKAGEYNPRKVHNYDVICDPTDPRGPNHYGNKRFGIVICMILSKDYNMKDVSVRVRVGWSVIRTIKDGDPHGGRFLARTSKGLWREVSDELAIKWISLVLKRAALALEKTANPKDPKTIADCVKLVMRTERNDDPNMTRTDGSNTNEPAQGMTRKLQDPMKDEGLIKVEPDIVSANQT